MLDIAEADEIVEPTIMRPVHNYRALWAAVLYQGCKDAAGDLRDTRKTGSTHTTRTLRWLHSENKRIGSYEWICDLLDIDPSVLRAAVYDQWRTLGYGERTWS